MGALFNRGRIVEAFAGMWANRAHKRFWVMVSALVVGVSLFVAGTPEEVEDSPQQKMPSTICGQTALTQEAFLDMVHAIAMHGDLTDVPFVEKTLQTKLVLKSYPPISSHGSDPDSKKKPQPKVPPGPASVYLRDSNPDRRTYWVLLDDRIGVSLDVSFNAAEYEKGKEPARKKTGHIDFSFPQKRDSGSQACWYLKNDQLKQTFGGGVAERISQQPEKYVRYGNVTACKEFPAVEKNLPLSLTYFFDKDSKDVFSVLLSHRDFSDHHSPCD